MEKQKLQTLRLWNPLFPKIYRKNEWDDTENEPEHLPSAESSFVLIRKDIR